MLKILAYIIFIGEIAQALGACAQPIVEAYERMRKRIDELNAKEAEKKGESGAEGSTEDIKYEEVKNERGRNEVL